MYSKKEVAMSIIRKSLNPWDYITFYSEIAFIIAEIKVAKERVFLITPREGASLNKFKTFSKKVLSTYKKEGVISAYVCFSDIFADKTASKYLLNLFPELKEEVNPEEYGFIVKI